MLTLEEAIQLRGKYYYLIGQKGKDIDADIYDVIVVPLDQDQQFMTLYRMELKDISNDAMLSRFPSSRYAVWVIYDEDPEFVDIVWEDIFVYLN